MKKVTFCLVCGATSPVDSARCQNCDAPLADKTKRKKDTGRRLDLNPLTILVGLAIVAVILAIAVHLVLNN